MSERRAQTSFPLRVFTTLVGLETIQHSLVGWSSTKTDQSVFASTLFVDSCAYARLKFTKHMAIKPQVYNVERKTFCLSFFSEIVFASCRIFAITSQLHR